MESHRGVRATPTRTHLLRYAGAVGLPLLGFLVFLIYQFADVERVRAEQGALTLALQMSRLIDGELSRRIAMLDGLAASQALDANDLATFSAEARRVVGPDDIILLRGLDTTQYVNTQSAPGAPLPQALSLTDSQSMALRAGMPVVTDVYASPVTGEPRIAIARPVTRQGELRILAMTVPTLSLLRVVRANSLEGWTIGIADRAGIYVTHSARHDRVSGKPGLSRFLDEARGASGTFLISNSDNARILSGYVRSPFSGWLFAANVPYGDVMAPVRRWLIWVALIAGATLAITVLAAYYYGREFTRAATSLAGRARMLGRASAPQPQERRIREFAIIGEALDRAAEAIDDRERVRERAREREAFLASIFDSSGLQIGIVGQNGDDMTLIDANQSAMRTIGRLLKSGSAANGDAANFRAMLRAAGQSSGSIEGDFDVTIEGRPYCFFGTFTRLDGERIAFTCIDITAGHSAQKVASERSRELELVLSTVPAGVWFSYDVNAVRVIRNRYASSLLRNAEIEILTDPQGAPSFGHIAFLHHGQPLKDKQMPLRQAMRGGFIKDVEYEIRFWDGTSRFVLMSASSLRGEQGQTTGAVAVALDITERKRDEEQKHLLLNELNHRVKNTLASVQSIAAQTLRTAATKQAAQHILTQRLIALAKAHDVLTSENWEGAWLKDVLRGALAPYPERTRFNLTGEDVWLSPSLALTFAMAIHELITNAIKYGALCAPEGVISMRWGRSDGEDDRLSFEWRESNGPPVAPPSRKGFGLRLLERGFSAERGGAVDIEYAESGLVCRIEFELGRQWRRRDHASTARGLECAEDERSISGG